jgi:hypothetical protein
MKTNMWLAILGAAWLAGSFTFAQDLTPAKTKGDRVNVRGQPSLMGEVITQLQDGEGVWVLDKIVVTRPKAGEPTRWFKILMPTNTPVWTSAMHVDSTTHTVKANRLNVRGGPGENYSVVGRLQRGAEVQIISVSGDWMEIAAPPGAYGFVVADYIEQESPPPPAASPAPAQPAPLKTAPAKPAAQRTAAPPPPTAAAATAGGPALPGSARASPPPLGPTPAQTQPTPTPAPTTAASEAEPLPLPLEPPPPRVVSREGKVSRTVSLQAPTFYELESLDTRRPINYLDASRLPFTLQYFRGRKVQITGEEKVDPRWPNVPVLEVETIRLVP